MKNKILSIQSKLVYGYVGANIAELAIQLHGLDVISFPTVLLSAHTGHQPSFGTDISKKLFHDLILGIKNLDLLNSTAGIISGYMGNKDVMHLSSDFINEFKDKHSDGFYICDPVMGDADGGLYIEEHLANKLITKLIPLADIITPNHFEIEYILGTEIRTIENLIEAISSKTILDGKTVIITSCRLNDTPTDQLEVVVVKNKEVKRVFSTRIAIDTTGTGDLFASMLASKLALGDNIISATDKVSTTISQILNYTVEQGNEEMNALSLVKFIR